MRDIYDSIDKIKCMNTQMTYNADAYMNNIHTSIDSNIPASVADIDSAVQRESKDRIIHTLIEYIRYHAHESSKYHKTYMNNIKYISSHVDIIHRSVQKIDQFKYATADKIKLLLSSHDVIRMKMSSKISSMQKAIDGILKDLSLIHHAHRHTRDAISHYRSSLQHEKGRYDALYNDMNKAVQQHNAHIKEYNSNIQTLNNTISYNRQQYDLHIHTLQDNHKSRDSRGGGSATNGKPKRVQSDSGQQVDMYGDDLCTILRIESRYDIVSEVKRRGEEYDKLKRGIDGLVSVVSSICGISRESVDIGRCAYDIIQHVCNRVYAVYDRLMGDIHKHIDRLDERFRDINECYVSLYDAYKEYGKRHMNLVAYCKNVMTETRRLKTMQYITSKDISSEKSRCEKFYRESNKYKSEADANVIMNNNLRRQIDVLNREIDFLKVSKENMSMYMS